MGPWGPGWDRGGGSGRPQQGEAPSTQAGEWGSCDVGSAGGGQSGRWLLSEKVEPHTAQGEVFHCRLRVCLVPGPIKWPQVCRTPDQALSNGGRGRNRGECRTRQSTVGLPWEEVLTAGCPEYHSLAPAPHPGSFTSPSVAPYRACTHPPCRPGSLPRLVLTTSACASPCWGHLPPPGAV